MAIPLITLIVMLPTVFGTPTDFKKDAGRSYFNANGVSPVGVVPYGKPSRPVLSSSPCDRKKCVSSPCCEPEPEFEKYTVPVQPIVAPTVVGYEYAEVSRPVEVPKCDRTACGFSRPCCEERVVNTPQQVSSFVVPNYSYNYSPYQTSGYQYPYYGGSTSNYGYGYPYAYTGAGAYPYAGAHGFANFPKVPNTIGSYQPNAPVPVVEGDAKLNRVSS